MAFTNAVLLKIPKLFAASSIIGAAANGILSNAVLLSPVPLHSCVTYVSTGNTSYSNAKLLRVPKQYAATLKLNLNPVSTLRRFSNAVLIKHTSTSFNEPTRVNFTKSAKFGFGYSGYVAIAPFNPSAIEEIEILYPIVPTLISGRSITQKDNKAYRAYQKPSGDLIYSTMKLRVKNSYMPTLLAFIRSNRTRIVSLVTPSIYPFGNSYVRSNVYIVSFTSPKLEKSQFWRIDITYLQIQGIS